MRKRLAIVAALAALAVPAAVAIAATTTLKGNGTDDPAVTVKMKRHGGKDPYVTAFETSNMLYECNDGDSFRSGVNLGTLKLNIKKSGKFSFSGTADEQGVHYQVKVSGKSKSKTRATGTTTETRSLTDGGGLKCTAKEPWEAEK